ncbi:MAG: mitochondrial 37S ribosomal protein rsm10 [Pycnora praestabilis]|nr:MAG: mitochondrial 37S ribosomal protein rsm10 [Pycnora praestabilis]
MSKSHEDPRSRILLTEEPEEIVRKIRLALTDSIVGISYDPLRRPGVSNLLEIMAHFGNGSRTCQELAHECNTLTMRQFKEKVADCIVSNLSGIRSEYYKILRADGGRFLDDVAEKGAKKARINAEVTMALVREAVGF